MPILKEVIGVTARLDTQAVIVKEVITYILLLPPCISKRFVTRLTAILISHFVLNFIRYTRVFKKSMSERGNLCQS